MRKFIIYISFFPLIINAQIDSIPVHDTIIIKNTEIKLMKCFQSLSVIKNDKKQNQLNDTIINYLKKIITIPSTFDYPFDSIKNMGMLKTSDESLRFYTWNVPYEDGTHKITGLIQHKINKDSIDLIILNDKSYEIENAQLAILNSDNWFGALYYDVVKKKVDKTYYYFLMGYHPYNLFSNKKILDVFYFDEFGRPIFGKPFFNVNQKISDRIIFEYNEKATMTLHYNRDYKMIIFHHLSPIDYQHQNNPVFLAPDSSFDGLKFENKMWNYYENVDVRNDI